MNFQPVDRLPVIEWAGWWTETLDNWYKQGLPKDLQDAGEIREYLGLDMYRQYWISPSKSVLPAPPGWGAPRIRNISEYQRFRDHLYPEIGFNRDVVKGWAAKQQTGEMVVWISLDGFFWYPRSLLGINEHLYAFYDQPELLHQMNTDLLDYNLRQLDQFCSICTPDFMTFGEDLSYNHGPMLSRQTFEEFLAPYYRKIVPELKDRGIVPFVDTDGDVTEIVPWFEAVGVEGFLPLERMAGVDICGIRDKHRRWKMIGAFDKTVMHLGEQAIRQEFERIFPVMQQGGYIPSVDHQTPPAVSLADYRVYVRILKEYCHKAGTG